MNVSPVETAPLTRAEVLERVQGIVDLPATIRPVADYAAAVKALPALRPLLGKDEELLSIFRKASEVIESALPPSLAAAPALCPPEKVELSKYRPPCFLIPEIALTFDLNPHETRVTCKMKVEWSYGPSTLVLNGEKLPIDSIEIDGRTLMPDEYRLFQDKLVLFNVPLAFELTICTRLNPSENKSASGLYMTDGLFATHCEPEAFRKIAYHPDRPDILSTYDVTLIADTKQCPVLLSNGDCVESADLEDGRHLRRFVDPIPKPSYLFALVAGDLATVEDTFITGDGREIKLAIFAAAKYTSGLATAMEALKSVMRWDDETYGRTYRHNEMRMVALDDFNAGACECTSLIMFNADCLVAHPKWSSDQRICDVVRTIAHEYIHYWNGNAVTVRSWHELALKEGSTTFKEAEFSEEHFDRAMIRVDVATSLLRGQFPEDSGPLAHPVLPPSYVSTRNLYTRTTYLKGAEVFRMAKLLLGEGKFHRAFSAYYERFDGQAVSIEDWATVVEEMSAVDLTQFRRWFHQAGTPELHVALEYDAAFKTARLNVKQSCKPTSDGSPKEPFHIPFVIGFLGADGQELLPEGSRLLEVTGEEQTFVFTGIDSYPTPSLLRGLSAPVKVHFDYSTDDLCHLLAHDSDAYVRYRAAEQILMEEAFGFFRDENYVPNPRAIEAMRSMLKSDASPAVKEMLFAMPSAERLLQDEEFFDPLRAERALVQLKEHLALHLKEELLRLARACKVKEPYEASLEQMGKRALQNFCYSMLARLKDPEVFAEISEVLDGVDNMTTRALLHALLNNGAPEAERHLQALFDAWKNDPEMGVPSVYQKWVRMQALIPGVQTIERLKKLMEEEHYDLTVPNNIYALQWIFCLNTTAFYDLSGAGFRFLADQILAIEKVGNGEMAEMVATSFDHYQKLVPELKMLMGAEIERILKEPTLSEETRDTLSKILGCSQ